MYKILAIDDEPKNLKLIELYLEEDKYEITTAANGQEGWDILQQDSKFDLVLLDRMMPVMNGMQLLKKIKEDAKLKSLPVILQTAAADPKQIEEGVNAGAFHYLTKPFDEEKLLKVIESCLRDFSEQKQLQNKLAVAKRMVGLITSCEIEYSTIEESSDVATYIAYMFPEPDRVVMGISELLINSVEHGNLGITYAEKTAMHKKGNWKEQIVERQKQSKYINKKVKVKYNCYADRVVLNIKDEGKGFNWQKYMTLSPERATDSHGRGIAMANAISFESIEYKGCGNEVECTVFFKKQ